MAKRTNARKQRPGTEAEIVLPAMPPEQGEPIDGSEDDTTELERNQTAPIASAVGSDDSAPAVAAAVRAVKKAAHKRVKEEPMSETSKAEMIRQAIAARKTAGEEKIRPRDIVADLAAKDVKVHAPQVSVALRDFGKPVTTSKSGKLASTVKKSEGRSRVLARVKSSSESAKPAAKPSASPMGPSYAELTATSEFVSGLGGLDKAREMLDAYARLLNPLK